MPAEQEQKSRIVVDGSEPAQAALRWAVRQARLTGAVIDAVTAWEIPIALGRFGSARSAPPDDAQVRQVAEQTAAEAIEAVADPADAVQIRTQVREGNAAGVLLAAADGADLLVVGNRGRGGFARALLGSVSLHCVQYAHGSVVVIRA
jgi:nucleotide-binding universal stress UspA family protein